jgi:hypothetical protein
MGHSIWLTLGRSNWEDGEGWMIQYIDHDGDLA